MSSHGRRAEERNAFAEAGDAPHLRLEEATARISAELLSPDTDLDAVLGMLGKAVDAERAYLFQMHDGGRAMSNTHMWTPGGPVSSINGEKQNMRPEAFPWWFEHIRQSEALRVRVPDLPPEADAFRSFLTRYDVQTLLDVPIRLSDGSLHGFVGFDDSSAARTWTDADVRLLRVVSDLLAGYFERQQAEQALRESEARHRALVERASDIMTIMERDGTVRYQSPSSREVLGRDPESMTGRKVFEGVHPDDREDLRAAFEACLHQPGDAVTVQVRARHADGSWVPLESTVRNMLDDPAIEGIVANTRDVSDSLRFEAEREARERAEELLQAKTAFLNNMSHELRTPLASILGFADVLADEGEGLQHDFAQRIAESGKRLQETLDSVLSLAQLEGGDTEIERQPVVVAERVREAVALLQPLAGENGLTLTARSPGDDAPSAQALLDPRALHRVLDNLIGNALKFTEEGCVTVTTEADDEDVRIRVRDTGIGIEEAFLPRLFDDFEQASTGLDRTHEGSGLGLAITQRLVDLMNGRIEAESTPGEGSCFTVSFPRTAPAERADEAASPQASAPRQAASASLLVVDDNENARMLAEHLLRPTHDVTTVPDADAARRQAEEHTFDLLIIDINLGGDVDGVTLLRALRDSPASPQAPAVALTAHAMPGDKEQFLDVGFDAYLSKPFAKADLLATVRTVLSPTDGT